MRKTKIVIFTIVLVLLLSISMNGFAVGKDFIDIDTINQREITNVKISLGGKPLNIPSEYGYPFLDNQSRTMIPLRIISEKLGHKVEWSQSTKTATIDGNVSITIGEKIVKTPNGDVIMDTKAILKDTRTYVPLRFVVEALGYEVTYDGPKASNGHNHMVDIFKEGMVDIPGAGEAVGGGYIVNTPYGDITLNPDTDIHTGYKQLRDDKATELLEAYQKSVKYVEHDGYITAELHEPILPEGFEWSSSIQLFNKVTGENRMVYQTNNRNGHFTESVTDTDVKIKVQMNGKDIRTVNVRTAIKYNGRLSGNMVTELKTGRSMTPSSTANWGKNYLFEDEEMKRIEDFYLPQYKK